jgi:uncharacterized protein
MNANSPGLLGLAAAMVVSTAIASSSWRTVKEKPFERTISVTGSAKKRITSDLIQWAATVEVREAERSGAFHTLHAQVDKTQAFLRAKGLKAADISPQSVTFEQVFETEVHIVDKERVEKQIPVGWFVQQAIKIRSNDVALVEVASREVTSLLEQGIAVRSAEPAYYYTKLGELKVEMLAAAAHDARTRAENIVKSAGGASIGDLVDADMGVININPANASTTSWEGNNDTTSLEKDILTIVHTKFALK